MRKCKILRETNIAGLLGSETRSKERQISWSRRKRGFLGCNGGARAGLTVELLDTEKELKKSLIYYFEGHSAYNTASYRATKKQRALQPGTLSQATTWQQEMNS